MSDLDRLKALLSQGYFPRELPPVFTTRDFGKHSMDVINEWEKLKLFDRKAVFIKNKHGKKKSKLKGSYEYTLKDAEPEIISKPKRGYERRNIHITHPIPQSLLSYEICFNWNEIKKWLLRQRYSLDKIDISKSYDRSIRDINFKIHSARKSFIDSTSDWLVRTDITRFYPSIYTHSIVWAAHGKGKVKSNLKKYRGSFADRLDVLVRHCNRNQTIGIPIGPETSRIIAEIISSRVDDELHRENPDINENLVDRLQDDWFIGLETLERSENVLSSITRIYRDFGLDINGSKTSVTHIMSNSTKTWISELSSFLSHSRRLSNERLREFLSLSLRLQSEFENDPVINYTISVIENRKILDDDIDAVESFLLKSSTVSPISMEGICRILVNVSTNSGKISKTRVCQRLKSLAEKNLENGNIYEAMWQIYTLRGLKVRFGSKRISELIEWHQGSVLPLILLDMKQAGLYLSSLPTDKWEASADQSRVQSDWIWLLAYEGFRKGWLKDHNDLLTKPFFKEMADRNIVFYDPRKNVVTSKSVARYRHSTRKEHSLEARFLIQTLRGFQASGY